MVYAQNRQSINRSLTKKSNQPRKICLVDLWKLIFPVYPIINLIVLMLVSLFSAWKDIYKMYKVTVCCHKILLIYLITVYFSKFLCRQFKISIPYHNMFKVNNRNARKRCETCSEFTIKTPERCQWCCSGVFIVNFEYILHLVLAFL